MAVRRGKCTNFGNCVNADSRKLIDVPDGADFVCPECGRQLNPVEERQASSTSPVLIVVVLLVLLGGALWYLRSRKQTSGVDSPAASALPATRGGAQIILRMHGSNTIGAQLGPALAQAYLRQKGAQDVRNVPGAADEVTVQGSLSGSLQAIEIAAHGSATAFADLADGKCDIGMASRQIQPKEVARLSSLGDMTSPAS